MVSSITWNPSHWRRVSEGPPAVGEERRPTLFGRDLLRLQAPAQLLHDPVQLPLQLLLCSLQETGTAELNTHLSATQESVRHSPVLHTAGQ